MQIERRAVPTNPAGLAPSRSMRRKFFRELAGAALPLEPASNDLVTEAHLVTLPEPAQRYLRFMAVVGRPRVWSLRLRAEGTFRLRPDEPWIACEAWQYDTRLEVARIFHMRLRIKGVMPVLVRDTYLRGRGRMLGRVLDTFDIVDDSSEMVQTGELVTYLNDAILLSPSMILGPEATWSAVSDSAFDVAFTDHGHTVKARVFVDDQGRVTDFSTTDRYGSDPDAPGPMVQARWSTPIRGWTVVDGRPVPTGAKAIWHFPLRDFAYADFSFDPGEIAFDVPPSRPSS